MPEASARETVRAALLERLRILGGRTARMEGHFRGEDGRLEADTQDVVSYNANDEVVDGLEGAASAEIREIRAALKRLESGTYGTCEACEEEIPAARLLAIPHARLCVDCADE